MWPSQLSSFLLAFTITTGAGSPLYAPIIPTITPTPLNASSLSISIPIPTFNSTSRVTRRTPLPLPPSSLRTSSSSSRRTSSSSHRTTTSSSRRTSSSSSTSVIIDTRSAVAAAPSVVVPRGDIHSAITTTTIYSNGHAYTVTQFSEVNPELSTIGLTTTLKDGTIVTTPATMPVVSGTSGTGSPWKTSVTSTATTSEDPGMSSRISVGLPTVTTVQ
ncbi:hypothetical protein F4805DRAFT_1291 [Annulohypoxylon moriforme]|nr:hypothetical protein F4805DRAFT_1291 [Annulohypoxylon moriforme]